MMIMMMMFVCLFARVLCLFGFGFVVVIIIQDVPFDLNVCVIVVHFTMNGGLSFIYYYFIIYLCTSLVVKCNIP